VTDCADCGYPEYQHAADFVPPPGGVEKTLPEFSRCDGFRGPDPEDTPALERRIAERMGEAPAPTLSVGTNAETKQVVLEVVAGATKVRFCYTYEEAAHFAMAVVKAAGEINGRR